MTILSRKTRCFARSGTHSRVSPEPPHTHVPAPKFLFAVGICTFRPRFTPKIPLFFVFVEILACKRGAKYERLSLDTSRPFSYSAFTPQGRTSQLIPVTRKHQHQHPLDDKQCPPYPPSHDTSVSLQSVCFSVIVRNTCQESHRTNCPIRGPTFF